MNKQPYRKICYSLENDLKEVKREIASLPNNLTKLLLDKVVSLARGNEDNYLLFQKDSIASKLDRIKGKAKSTLNTLQLSSLETDSEKMWQDKLINIVLEVDRLLQEVKRKANFLDGELESEGLQVNANDLPSKLNLKTIEEEKPSNSKHKEVLTALKSLYEQGILTKEEYDKKVAKLE